MKATANPMVSEGLDEPASESRSEVSRRVTWRAMGLGLLLSVGVAAINCWISTLYNVLFLGGVQMPLVSVFVLMVLVVCINKPLAYVVRSVPSVARILPVFSPVELLTIYSMTLFAALVSTPGADNFFLTAAPTLFYFSTRENGWADLFYQYVPSHFAPGWDGKTFSREVIDPLYQGGLTFNQIPWHAWAVMLLAWSGFLILSYGLLFFTSLALRKQWVEREALTFPLVVLPVQMVEVGERGSGNTASFSGFWSNGGMWIGFALACALHSLRGLNAFYPEAPVAMVNQINPVWMVFTEAPFNAIAPFKAELFLSGIGVAFLLTREVSLSFWFFFLAVMAEKVISTQLGFSTASMPTDTSQGQPIFITFQAVGGWVAMAATLLWAAREHLRALVRAAFSRGSGKGMGREDLSNEPFSPRVIVLGFVACFLGMLGWCAFSGINLFYAGAFLVIYLGLSIVIARLVVEGGFLFPQIPFSPLEWMTTAMFSTPLMGAANLTRLSFLQPPLLSDMRTSVLPGFLHALKIADDLQLERNHTRRLISACLAAVVVAFGTTIVVTLCGLYAKGGLTGYGWFTYVGPQTMFNGTAQSLRGGEFEAGRVGWMAVGAMVVWMLLLARARLVWFPLHPLGYIMASGYPMTRLWFSFFVGWVVKSLAMRFGGSDTVARIRPFMIGLILGNLTAMIFWAIISLWTGHSIMYWPA